MAMEIELRTRTRAVAQEGRSVKDTGEEASNVPAHFSLRGCGGLFSSLSSADSLGREMNDRHAQTA